MPKNAVQFQRGVSLRKFKTRYGTEERYEQALVAWRWADGFVCPECGHGGHCVLGRGLFQCNGCRRQSSLTTGTLFGGTELALATWFLAIYLLIQSKNGDTGRELNRQLVVSYNSAWLLKHKLMQAMRERESARALEGVIQIDDAYWGGRRRGHKRGRVAPCKTPFVTAVGTVPRGETPLTMRMDRGNGFRNREVGRWSLRHRKRGSHVHSDALACFRSVEKAGCSHEPMITSGLARRSNRKRLTWVDTMLGNVKNPVHGTYHEIRAKHLPRYLTEFAYRFNRRFDLAAMIARLGTASAATPPMPYRLIKLAEAHW